jgi:hypothetical protein
MTDRTNRTHGTAYRNGVLTVICGLLAILAMRDPGSAVNEAAAADPPNVPNAFAQRLQIVEELKELKTITTKLTSIERTVNSRLDAIESAMVEQTAMMKAEQKRRGKEGNEE